ncbi:MerR family regulatory protein [Ectothiorhodospira magna]|uniref:MerR family regulatory protein n=2 Tax=Ectothiorhodospira magna TaxID=867345 RepID=A0A1H9GSJ0_9GAMM|nr:MerR family regulatory protein [Ectothiorhodospira magna]
MSTGKAAKRLGVSVKTLQRWDREGRLIPAARTDSNRRLYTEAQLREFIGWRHAPEGPTRLVAYCRVSSKAQKPDLANQRRVLEFSGVTCKDSPQRSSWHACASCFPCIRDHHPGQQQSQHGADAVDQEQPLGAFQYLGDLQSVMGVSHRQGIQAEGEPAIA